MGRGCGDEVAAMVQAMVVPHMVEAIDSGVQDLAEQQMVFKPMRRTGCPRVGCSCRGHGGSALQVDVPTWSCGMCRHHDVLRWIGLGKCKRLTKSSALCAKRGGENTTIETDAPPASASNVPAARYPSVLRMNRCMWRERQGVVLVV